MALSLGEGASASEEIDFPKISSLGDVRQGQVVTKSVPLHNTTDVDLVIDKVVGTCGCMLVSNLNETVLPRDTITQLPMVFDSTGRTGKVQLDAIVIVHKLDTPLRIRFEGFVLEEYPTVLNLGILSGQKENSLKFTLHTFPGQPMIEVFDVFYDKSEISVQYETLESGIEFTVGAVSPDLDIDTNIKIVTNDNTVPEKLIKVLARKEAPFALSQNLAKFANVARGDEQLQEISLISSPHLTIESIHMFVSVR